MKKCLDLSDTRMEFSINESYAKRFEHNKRREELQQLEGKYPEDIKDLKSKDDTSSSSESETEDENAELLTPEIDAQLMQTLSKIKNKSKDIYDSSNVFFSEEQMDNLRVELKKRAQKSTNSVSLKEFQYESMKRELERNGEEELEGSIKPSFFEEQEALKRTVLESINRELQDADGELLSIKRRTEDEKESYKQFLLEHISKTEPMASWHSGQDDGAEEGFLANYVLNQSWKMDEQEKIQFFEDSESELEEAEAFETTYNFRFEQPGGSDLISHSRNISGVRKEDASRKQKRKEKAEKRAVEKRREQEELKHLKNLKKIQLAEKINQIAKISGKSTLNLQMEDLEDDFDPEKFDKRMNELFNEEYYAEKDSFRDIEDSNEALKDILGDEEVPLKREAKKLEEEYYNLHYEDKIDGIKTRFKYGSIVPSTFGLSLGEILLASEKSLNKHVSLRKLAPYRPISDQKDDISKYSNKKRLRSFYNELRRHTSNISNK